MWLWVVTSQAVVRAPLSKGIHRGKPRLVVLYKEVAREREKENDDRGIVYRNVVCPGLAQLVVHCCSPSYL